MEQLLLQKQLLQENGNLDFLQIEQILQKELLQEKKSVSPDFVDSTTKEIFKRGEHALIGISPFNSYFSETVIYNTLLWVKKI